MIFDVYRYATGVTMADQRNPAKVTAALANPNCYGVAEQIEASNAWAAMDEGGRRFARFEFTPSPQTVTLCEQLVARVKKQGGGS